MKNVLVVGSGLSGAVLSRLLADSGKFRISVIEKRNEIGGNIFDYTNSKGIRVHKYGPHLFHTNNETVANFVKKYSEWVEYKHKVKAMLNDGRYVTLPVNNETKNIVGEDRIVETFYRPYSEKMWGMKLEQLSPDIMNRVPVRDDDNEYYFPNDKFQLIPEKGYSHFINQLFKHELISLKTNTPFNKEMENDFDLVLNSMAIDEYYDFKFGRLEYRSIKFHHLDLPLPRILPSAVVNFTHKGPFTRITEWKVIPCHGQNDMYTSVTYEEPCDPQFNNDEKYYPVKDLDGINRDLYNKYKEIKNDKVIFIGRLGLYSYLDMDQCINISLQTAKKILNNY
jgi:UDP-galactopyranose mutase